MSLDPRIPYGQIRWLVGRQHVGATDEAIRDDIAERARHNEWPVEAAQDFAVQVHRENQALYDFVTTGFAA